MEKLSERIHTLVPRKIDKLKADLVDSFIYLVTLIPIFNTITPLYGKEDYEWFKAIIVGTLIFVVLNYFIRYYLPLKLKGKTIGKLLFNIKTVDYYGYEVKSGQLLSKEFIYIFFPILVFSKFTNVNNILVGLWLLLFLISIFNSYLLSGFKNFLTRKEAKSYLKKQEEEITPELIENTGLNLNKKVKELRKAYNTTYKAESKKQKELLNDLKHKQGMLKVDKSDKQKAYDLEVKQKLEQKELTLESTSILNAITDKFNIDMFDLEKQELAKLNESISSFTQDKIDAYNAFDFETKLASLEEKLDTEDKDQKSAVKEEIKTLKKENNQLKKKANESFLRRTRLFFTKRDERVQGRSLNDLRANTITVDAYKFDKFFEEHRTEE